MNYRFWPIIAVPLGILLLWLLLFEVTAPLSANEKSRRITVICTNDTRSYLDACGCGGRHTGGLVRRATLIASLRSEKSNCVIVESGNLMASPPAGSKYDSRTLELVAEIFKIIGYDAVGIGESDLPYGASYYKTLGDNGVAVLQVDSDLPSDVKPYIIKVVDGVRVGILSFGAVSADKADSVKLARARYTALRDARQSSDILILLDQSNIATTEWLQRASIRFGIPDIVVGGANRLPKEAPELVGRTMIVPTSREGVYVGCVDVEIGNGEKKLTYTRLTVDKHLEKDTKVKALVDEYYGKESSSLMKTKPVKEKKPYFYYQTCKSCHAKEYKQWQNTPHAGALTTLVKQNKAIPLCLQCHSEKYRITDSLAIGEDNLQAVECASCHSDVLPHDADFKKKGDAEAVKARCVTCHTPERSPSFDLEKALKIINHKCKQ